MNGDDVLCLPGTDASVDDRLVRLLRIGEA